MRSQANTLQEASVAVDRLVEFAKVAVGSGKWLTPPRLRGVLKVYSHEN